MHSTISSLITRAQNVPFCGTSAQRDSDSASDIRKAGNIQHSVITQTNFTGDSKQYIQLSLQLFEHYSRQNNLCP